MSDGRFSWAGFLLGFSLGGFFDGILLHQILQWHHLLSAVNGADIRFQVAADGYFHALMYVIAAVGLWLLWRERERGRVLPWLLIGFGAWHMVDALLSHWITGIHRIRMDSDNPLFWDVLWLVVFGLVPLALGWMMRRGGHMPPAIAPCLAAVVLGAGAWAAQPPKDSPFTTVLFAPGTSSTEAMNAVAGVGGRIAWTDTTGQLVVFEGGAGGIELIGRGAILVSGVGLPAGCYGWARV